MATFKAGESKVSTTAFRERKNYKENFKIDGYQFLDTWYENPFYAKLNEKFEPVYLEEDPSVQNLVSFGNISPTIKSSPFLVKAYNTFFEEYSAIVENTNIGYPEQLAGLIPISAHKNFDALYSDYKGYVTSKHLDKIRAESTSYNFKQFMDRLVYYSLESFSYTPLTRSGFLMSSLCDVGVSGMTLQLADLPSNLDANKSALYNDPAFKCYLDFSRAHGFIVDKNLPWRLYANLQSPEMQGYITSGGQRNYLDYLNRFYRTKPAFDDSFSLFKFGVSAYVDYSGLISGNIFSQALQQYKTDKLTAEEGFLMFLIKVRMLELGIPMKEYKERSQKMLDFHRVHAVKYELQGKNRLDPIFGQLLKMASDRYREILENRDIDSYKQTTLKDYM